MKDGTLNLVDLLGIGIVFFLILMLFHTVKHHAADKHDNWLGVPPCLPPAGSAFDPNFGNYDPNF